MIWIGVGLLLLVAVSAWGIVTTHDATEQVIALGFYGLLMSLVFFFFRAPDVALSQITVGAVALPLMVMLAISRMKFHRATQKEGDGHD